MRAALSAQSTTARVALVKTTGSKARRVTTVTRAEGGASPWGDSTQSIHNGTWMKGVFRVRRTPRTWTDGLFSFDTRRRTERTTASERLVDNPDRVHLDVSL